jgi:tetratricopeptide (TPR) repeat protein
MKIKLLITGLSLLAASGAFAQKGELSNAQSEFDKYEGLRSNKTMAALANTSLTNAKTSIDKAAANEKTATLPQTYAVKGAVYASLALNDTIPTTSVPLFATAEEALKKAKETDAKGDYKKMVDNAYTKLVQYKYNKGVKDYGKGDYNAAYDDFNFYKTVMPTDTNALYLTGLAAANAKKYNEAIDSYGKLVNTNYSKSASVYSDLSSLYLMNKDTAGALKAISEGMAKFPKNSDLSNKQINIYLQSGKMSEVTGKLESAIANDPKNKALYFNSGIVYAQAKNYSKAEEMYRKALEIDPNYFEANMNLGYLLLSPGIELFNKANKLPASKQKEYDADMVQASKLFDVAKPYLVKAVELNPKSVDALSNLRTYYQGKRDQVNADATKKRIDALKQ